MSQYQNLLEIATKVQDMASKLVEIEKTQTFHPLKEDTLLQQMYMEVIQQRKALERAIGKETLAITREMVLKQKTRHTVH